MCVLLLAACVSAQDRSIKPPSENATLAELEKWSSQAIAKYGSYKVRATSESISNVRFQGCVMTYSLTRRLGTLSNDSMGTTTKTNTIKQDVSIDLARIAPGAIGAGDHVYPELTTVTLPVQDNGLISLMTIVLKSEAGEPVAATLRRIQQSCGKPQ